MAQVDIGKIKIVWKGPWNSGTAYTVDDAVSHSGNSYICIQAGTNQNPSSATAYWQIMASAGTNGTDADLLNISGTVQGDIYYNNGSAIARLAPGTASQVLKTGGAGANPSWGTLSSDYVKLASNYATGINNSNNISIDGYFTSDYKIYKLYATSRMQNNWLKFRLNQNGSAQTNTWYRYTGVYNRVQSGNNQTGNINGWNNDYFVSHSYWTASTDVGACGEYTIFDPLSTTTRCKLHWKGAEQDASWWYNHHHTGYLNDAGAVTGLTFFPNGGDFTDFGWSLYGLKA